MGIFENKYRNHGKTDILIRLVRLHRSISGQKLALNKLLYDLVTCTPKYLKPSQTTLNGINEESL